MTKNLRGFGRIAAAAATVALIGVLAAGCGQQPQKATGQANAAPPPAPQKVSLNLTVVNGGNSAHSDWPFFSEDGKNPLPANFQLPANAIVTVTIKNYDDGGGDVPAAEAKVTGTVGNTETVNGQAQSSFNAKGVIAHTFTVAQLGLNIPLIAATDQGSTVVPSVTVATFKTPAKGGTFAWQCYQPCGSGSDGWGGTMATAGWMMGNLVIQ